MAAAPTPSSTLTPDAIAQLTALYGPGGSLKAGTPLSWLGAGYTALGGDQLFDPNTGQLKEDPTRDQLLSEGVLQWTGDPGSRDSRLTLGPQWQANVPAQTLAKGQLGGPSEVFGSAPITGFTATPSTMTGVGGHWSKSPTFSAADPFSGLQTMVPGSGGAYDFQKENIFDKMGPGPIMGLMMGGLMGAGGIFGAEGLGSIGSTLFKLAGNAITGNNPFAAIQSLFGGGGGGGGGGSGQPPTGTGGKQMTAQQWQQFLPFLLLLSRMRGGGGNG